MFLRFLPAFLQIPSVGNIHWLQPSFATSFPFWYSTFPQPSFCSYLLLTPPPEAICSTPNRILDSCIGGSPDREQRKKKERKRAVFHGSEEEAFLFFILPFLPRGHRCPRGGGVNPPLKPRKSDPPLKPRRPRKTPPWPPQAARGGRRPTAAENLLHKGGPRGPLGQNFRPPAAGYRALQGHWRAIGGL